MKIGGCIRNFLKNLRFKKKAIKNEMKILKNAFYANFIITNCIFMSNLNVECFQLSFDIHIVHVSKKLRIFKNRCTESEQISAVKVGYFGATLRQNYAT